MGETVVVALDSFKGSIGAADAARAVRDGWRSVRPDDDIRLVPMADGGEGTLDAFAAALPDAVRMPVTVTGPHDAPVEASWLLLPPTPANPGGTAVVELAATSGIELLGSPPRLRPMDAHTLGLGETVRAALAAGVSRLVLAIGSSASTDWAPVCSPRWVLDSPIARHVRSPAADADSRRSNKPIWPASPRCRPAGLTC